MKILRKKKEKLLVLLVTGVMISLFFLVSSSAYTQDEYLPFEGKGLAPVGDETVNFRGWQFMTQVVEQNVERYNKELGGNVNYETLTGDYSTIIENKFIAKDPIDIFYGNPNDAVRYYEAGWLIPAESLPNIEEIKADLYPNVLDAWSYKGKLMGLSYFLSDQGIMHVNLKKFAEAGISEKDFPKTWDELYDQLYVLRDAGIEYPYLPYFFNEWYGISWGFVFETLNRGQQLVDAETHRPIFTADGPVGDTLRDWKRIWNDGLVQKEVLTYMESDYLNAWGSGNYVYSPQQSYDLKKFNDPHYSSFAGYCSILPNQGQSWGFLGCAMYMMSNQPRSEELDHDVKAFLSWYGFKDHEDKGFVGSNWVKEAMLFSGYRSVMEDPENIALIRSALARPEDFEVLMDSFEKTLYPKDLFQNVWWTEYNSWLKETLMDFLMKDRPVDETVKTMYDKMNELADKYKNI